MSHDLAGANGPSVPLCQYCALHWDGQGLDHPGRRYHRPCRCRRLELGGRLEAHEDWQAEAGDEWWSPDPHTREHLETRMRQQVEAARVRHLAHRRRFLGDV